MMTKPEFGIRLPHSGPLASVENVETIIDEAENLGFHAIWVHNHIQWTQEMHNHHVSSGAAEALKPNQDPNFYESITTLAYAAAKSPGLKVGIAALVLASYNPIIVAKQLANIDNLSRGRLQVVIGLGASVSTVRCGEFDVLGIPAKKRKDVLEEKLLALKEVWTKPSASFHGKYVNFDNAVIYPKPIQKPHPPLIYGGPTTVGMEKAARLYDGWFVGAGRSPAMAKEAIHEFHDKTRKYGRGNQNFVIGVERKLHMKKTHDEAVAGIVKTIEGNKGYMEREPTFEGLLGSALIGSETEVFNQVSGFVDAGVRVFEMKPVYRSIDELVEIMKTFSRVIFPSFS